MKAGLIVYDDERARMFQPFALTRPASELLFGIATIRERWEHALGMRAAGFVSSPHLVEFQEGGAPPFASGDIAPGSIIAHSRFAPALLAPPPGGAGPGKQPGTWLSGGHVAAVRVRDSVRAADLVELQGRMDRLPAISHETVELEGVWLNDVWDLICLLPAQLNSDLYRIHGGSAESSAAIKSIPADFIPIARLREIAAIVGDAAIMVARSAVIDPYVVLDARNGPILIASGATLHSYSRIEGPCFIGPDTVVMSGRISSSAIGEKCRICGEVSNIIVLGHSNKAHDGFVGHSYLGRWVNIGAGTITSNLKNTYGPVSLWTPSGSRSTEMQFLGTFFGDHSRTGIGTSLSTGTVLGAGSNVFGGVMPPRYVPPFTWGTGGEDGFEEYRLEKFLEVAERVMMRRQVSLTDGLRRHYEEVHRIARRGSAG